MAHPFAKVDLKLKKAKGMKRKYSWVVLRTFKMQLGTLGLYEQGLGEYCLTGMSLRKLREGIERVGGGRKVREKGVVKSAKKRWDDGRMMWGEDGKCRGKEQTSKRMKQDKRRKTSHRELTWMVISPL